MDIPSLFAYPYSDTDTTDELEKRHVENIKRILAKGFLSGKVISNPSSLEYLELQSEIDAKEIRSLTTQLENSKEQAREREESLLSILGEQKKKNIVSHELCSELQQKLEKREKELIFVRTENNKLEKIVSEKNEIIGFRTNCLIGVSAVLLLTILVVVLL